MVLMSNWLFKKQHEIIFIMKSNDIMILLKFHNDKAFNNNSHSQYQSAEGG